MKGAKGMRIINAAVRESNKTKYDNYPSIVEVAAKPEEYQQLYGVVLTATTDAIIDENAIDM
jgi:hypothetical protein